MEEWLKNLAEAPRSVENDLIHDTTDEELAYIARRVVELGGVGSSCSVADEAKEGEGGDAEEVKTKEESEEHAEEHEEEHAKE